MLPVYWQRDGDELQALAVAPFYWRGKNSQIVFPLYWSFEDGKYRGFFPVYGRVEGVDSEWLMAMWPAYMRRTKGQYRKHHVLWPLLTWGGDGMDQSEFAIWPLYGVKKNQRESRKEGRWKKESTYTLWRVFDARFQPNGDHRVSVLWRGYRNEKQNGTLKVDIFPFMSYRRTDADNKRFRFLAGFFEWGSESGKRHLRLFYLPKISLGRSGSSKRYSSSHTQSCRRRPDLLTKRSVGETNRTQCHRRNQ